MLNNAEVILSNTKSATVPLRVPSLKRESEIVRPVIPTSETKKLTCYFCENFFKLENKSDISVWQSAQEAIIGSYAVTGLSAKPLTYVRFLWDRTNLFFHVEVESGSKQEDDCIHHTEVWRNSNIEFIIAPQWYVVPRYNEFEFLFNQKGDSATLHWTQGRTLNESLAWNPKGLNWKVSAGMPLKNSNEGWTLDGHIPFEDFKIGTPKAGDYYGLGLFRTELRKNLNTQFLAWSPTFHNPAAFHAPLYFGMLEFTENLPPFSIK
jgi:hypothetical protein